MEVSSSSFGGDSMTDLSDYWLRLCYLTGDLVWLPIKETLGVYLNRDDFRDDTSFLGLRKFLNGFAIEVINVFCLSPEKFF